MRERHLKAKPERIRFREEGYELTVKVTDGPATMIDRYVRVTFTAEQLDAIGAWEPSELLAVLEL